MDCIIQASFAHMIVPPEENDEARIVEQLEYTLNTVSYTHLTLPTTSRV